MYLELRELLGDSSKNSISFSQELDLSHVAFFGSHPFSAPVRVTGKVERGEYGELETEYTAESVRTMSCARCLAPVREEFRERFVHTLRESDIDPEEEDEFIPLQRGRLDVGRMAASDLLLEMEGIALCSPDCLGLCPICGGNRNDIDCKCERSEPDPRFDALRDLMNNGG
ncbi:MAG: YceD family protein [Oscillospiraceae bacterium]